MRPVKVLSFDLDGTLLDGGGSKEAIFRTCGKLAEAAGLDAARLSEANSEVWRSYWPEVEDRWTLGVLSGAAVSLEAWRRTLLACGRDDESLVRLAGEIHSQHARNALRLFDDVKELLKLLKPRLRLALITNGASDTQRGALRILGLGAVFDAVVISGEVGIAKPNASVFTIALNKLGVEPEMAWHVGDSLRTDVAGALGAGITAVWLNRGGVIREKGDPEPDFEIRSLGELAELISEEP